MNPAHLHFTLRLVARLALAVALIGTASAQTLTGALSGRVSGSSSGQSLQGAIVRVVGTELRADTARDGSYDLRALPAGRYEVEASYFGLEAKRASVEIIAGRPASLNFLLGSDAIQLEAVKVEAAVLGQARAINQQRVAESMVNVTSEELFGETTDNNIARAIQRVPGVSANSDGGTEVPRYVNIRGFDATLNSVQLNGTRLPTTNDGTSGISSPARGFALDDLPASAITNIEIIKAPTPDMDGDAVGGIVNLITKSAFERGETSFDLNAGVDYVALREKFVPHVDVGYSGLAMDGRLGLRLDLSYYKGDEGFDNIDYDSNPLAAGQPQNTGLGLTDGSVFFHEDTEYNNYFIERNRYGLSASIDYKLSDSSSLYFKPVYTYEKRVEDDRRFHKILDNDHGRAASAPPAGTAVGAFYTGTRGRAIATSATTGTYSTYTSASRAAGRTTLLPNGTGRGSVGYRQSLNEIEPTFYSLDFGGDHQVGASKVKWSAFLSEATRPEVRESVRFDRNGFQWAYDRPDILRPDYRTIGGPDAFAIPTRGNVDFFINPSSSNIVRSIRETQENVWQLKTDLSTPFFDGTGVKGTFKTGAKLRSMDREHDRNFRNYALTSNATFDFAGYTKPSDYTVSDFRMGYIPDTARILSEASSGNAAYRRDTANARLAQNLASDYEATESSYEGYAMGVVDVGPKLRLITGVRVEQTQFEADTPVYDATAAPATDRAARFESRKTDYTQVLPGFHLRYEARNNIVVRGAYTHTYSRPSFRELIAVTTFDELNNVITSGNPDLEPYKSENWDFSIEYFGKKASYFQAAFFHKKVSGQVLESGESFTGVSNFRGLALNPGDTYTYTSFSNQHNSTNWGIELVGRYRFITLPAPFDGLYLDSSVTYTDSNGSYADRPGEKLPTYGGSEWLWFAGIGYQKDRLSLLLSYRYRSPYLEGLENVDRQNRDFGLPSNVGDDWWGEEKYVNLETSYRLTKAVRAYCNISNLTEFTNYSTQSPFDNDYPEDSYWHKMRISFGIKARF
jgi:TonB-dependent receptor